MESRPVPFTGEMVRAILAGQKTQTRRVMKPQPVSLTDAMDHGPCPYGAPGDRLWVKETWQALHLLRDWESGDLYDWEEADLETIRARISDDCRYCITYRADGDWDGTVKERGFRWRPSRFMPKWASRIMLEIVNVWVERVREITEDDAREEGIIIPDYMAGTVRLPHGGAPVLRTSYRSRFADLWDSINAKRGYGWDTNPWVWVIEFKRVETKGGE